MGGGNVTELKFVNEDEWVEMQTISSLDPFSR